MTEPISPPPLRTPEKEHLPAYLSNGLFGLRVGPIPFLEGLCTVGGLAGLDPADGIEAFARGPYPFAGDIEIDGVILSRSAESARFVEQRYDFSCGELQTRFIIKGDRADATVDVLNFCSRTLPTLAEIRVTVDGPCSLTVVSGLSATGVGGRPVLRATGTPAANNPPTDGMLLWETHGAMGRCGAAYSTDEPSHQAKPEFAEPANDLAPLLTRYQFEEAQPGTSYVVRQIVSLVPSASHSQPDREACRMVCIGKVEGFDNLREGNRRAWQEIWRSRVVLLGADERWQGIADAAFYYLQVSAHPSSLFSTSMFGLAYWPTYHYYHGHVMWDIESFALPPLLLTAPATAAALLAYRYERLPAARRNAALQGHTGAQFPWESGPGRGDEMVRTDGPMLGVERHVSFSVALACARYFDATDDVEFLRERAWPILRDVATWTMSRLISTDRGLELHGTMGIAEGRPHPIDNSAYENVLAKMTLRAAAGAAVRLGISGDQWGTAADLVFLPIDERRGTLKNHDRFTARESGSTGATPEAAAGFFPGGYIADAQLERATLKFALERVEPYIGSPMLSAPLGVYAAWIGDRKRSAELFEQGYAEFVLEPFRETNEYSYTRFPEKPRASPLIANVGGFLTSLMIGLPRMDINGGDPATWCTRTVVMPDLWDEVSVERMWVRGRPAKLTAHHGESAARLEVQSGDEPA